MMNANNMDATTPPILFHATSRRKEKEFWETVKSHLTYKGYYDKFPTPRLLREAQEEYRSIGLDPPLDATGKPLPYPAMKSKKDIIDIGAIQAIDSHALGAPRVLAYEDMFKLVKYLIGDCQNDVEKLRAIFRWIASQNLKQWHDEVSFNRDSAAFYLARIRAKKTNHNQLLQRMCSLANIYCVKVRGYVKGVDYGLGHELTDCDSTWTAVLVDGAWRLLDVYWATCHRVHSGDSSWELIDDGQSDLSSLSQSSTPRDRQKVSKTEYAYNDYYFLTDPEQFIYSHYPIDEKWQLLARPVNIEEAKRMALIKRNFFSLGMDILSHPRYIIECEDGEEEVTFATPKDVKINYKYELYVESDSESAEELHNMSLDRYVYLENVTKENLLNVRMRFPATGKYKLKLLAKEHDEQSFYYTVTYIIDVLSPLANCRPLPKNERGEWGPGIDTEELGIEPITHDTGEVPAEDGKAEVRFGLKKDVEFKHKLLTGDDQELPNRVIHRVENQEAVFNIRVPQEGEYAFNVYAKETGAKGEFPNVCNYLLKCDEEPEDKQAFPEIGAEKLGPTEAFEKFGMKNISVMPALMLAPVTGEVILQFKLNRSSAVFIPELILQNEDGSKTDFSEYTMWDILNGIATFYITIPRVGMYSLAIRAKPNMQAENFTPVFHSIIDALIPKKQCLPCPQQSIDWPPECRVNRPITGVLPAREMIRFELDFPKAYELVATSGNGSKPLRRNPQGHWEGEVLSGNEDSVVTISVRYSETMDSHYILTYKVINRDEIVGEKLRQLDRYKAAVARAHDLRESGKLPKNFDWSRLEDTEDEEIDELLKRLLRDQRREEADEDVDKVNERKADDTMDEDKVAECSGDELGEAVETSSEEGEITRDAEGDVVDAPGARHEDGNQSSDSDDEEIRELLDRKRHLVTEKERLKIARQRRSEAKEKKRAELKAEIQELEYEVTKMNVRALYVERRNRELSSPTKFALMFKK